MTYTAINKEGQMYLRAENPHTRYDNDPFLNYAYAKFQEQHPPLICLFPCKEGDKFVLDRDFRVVWQILHPVQNKWYSENDDLYQYFKDYEEYRSQHENEGGHRTRQAASLIEAVKGEETVEEAVMVEMGVSYAPHMTGTDEAFVHGATFGAQWQSEQHAAERDRLKQERDELIRVVRELRTFIDDVVSSCAGGEDQLYYCKNLADKALANALKNE